MKKINVGIDLGGTKTAIGIVSEKGEILFRHIFESTPHGYTKYMQDLEVNLEILLGKASTNKEEIRAVGVGCAGQIELGSGKVYHAPNLGWKDVPLGADLRRIVPGAKITVDNDVRAATLGEYLFGLDSRPDSYVNIFLGTGIGSGIILNDWIHRGHTNSAGEIGQTSILYTGPISACGNRGIYEYYGSGSALGRMARERIEAQLLESPKNTDYDRLCDIYAPEEISGKIVGELAKKNHPDALFLIDQLSIAIGTGLANLINFFNPEVITWGGGLCDLGEILMAKVILVTEQRAISTAFAKTTLIPARLKSDAGIIGAAWLNLIDENGNIQNLPC